MSVSSHLSPEPERRLWIVMESMRQAVEWTEVKIGALVLFAGAELAFIKLAAPSDHAMLFARACLALALPLGVLGFSPLSHPFDWLPVLEPPKGKRAALDALVTFDDLIKYTHGELINAYDKYFGGGITATQYYEDLVGQVLLRARVAARKHRLFRALCWLVGLAQLALLGQLILR